MKIVAGPFTSTTSSLEPHPQFRLSRHNRSWQIEVNYGEDKYGYGKGWQCFENLGKIHLKRVVGSWNRWAQISGAPEAEITVASLQPNSQQAARARVEGGQRC